MRVYSVDFNGEIRKVINIRKGRFKDFFYGDDLEKPFITYHFYKDRIKDERSDTKQATSKNQQFDLGI